jgi:CTP:molybdopterin cytidylyltransferase MocA
MSGQISDDFVKRVLARADVPRVRSSEVKRIIEATIAEATGAVSSQSQAAIS